MAGIDHTGIAVQVVKGKNNLYIAQHSPARIDSFYSAAGHNPWVTTKNWSISKYFIAKTAEK
ncbi:MAG: hypothetical protein JWQ47_1774 [Glaciihabitans sp.]|nr:hypothetical protein [Glaciihabitans sp.]